MVTAVKNAAHDERDVAYVHSANRRKEETRYGNRNLHRTRHFL